MACVLSNFMTSMLLRFQNLAPSLDVSLQASGKSRADLWALAAIVGIEYGIDTNNMLCDGTYNRNPEAQCNEDIGTDHCKVSLWQIRSMAMPDKATNVNCFRSSCQGASSLQLDVKTAQSLVTNCTKRPKTRAIPMLLAMDARLWSFSRTSLISAVGKLWQSLEPIPLVECMKWSASSDMFGHFWEPNCSTITTTGKNQTLTIQLHWTFDK